MSHTHQRRQQIYRKILTLTKSGTHSVTAICGAVGIDRSTYYRWEQDDPQFAEQVLLAREYYRSQRLKKANQGLDKLLTGYQYEEKTYEFTHIKDADGNEVQDFRLTKQTTKFVQPNASTVQFVLRNMDHQTYPDTSRQEVTGKDGKDLIPENLPWFDSNDSEDGSPADD